MKQYCFFCFTPFQIMTAIHICLLVDRKADIDLYVVDQFSKADQVVKRLAEIGIFRNVIIVHEDDIIDKSSKSKIVIWHRIASAYIELDKVARKILGNNYNCQYDIMFISSKAFVSRIVALFYAKNEYKTEIVYFDDGLGSYYNKRLLYPRLIDRIYRRILLGKNVKAVDPKTLLLYDTDLFYSVGAIEPKNIIIKKIPKWRNTQEFINVLNKVFAYSVENNIKEQVIIIDGLYTGRQRKLVNEFYEKIANLVGKENMIIKRHPRDKTDKIKEVKYYNYPSVPFELICLNEKMDERLLITVSSTAVITPILLLDEEPYVLTLNNIKGLCKDEFKVNYDDFKGMYHNKTKFYNAANIEKALVFVKRYYEGFIEK